MAVNKVVINTENGEKTLIDLTEDTVTPKTLAAGVTAHDASGNIITGTATDTVISLTKSGYSTLTEDDITKYYNDGVRAIIVEDGYTNLVSTAIGENGVVYYGCGYRNGYRLTSSGTLAAGDSMCLSGYIVYPKASIVRVVGSTATASAGGQYVAVYDASFNLIDVDYISVLVSYGSYTPRADGMYELTIDTSKISAWSNAKYFRVSCANCVGADLVITKDEEIGLEV